jgi:DNA replicative helicase MCM subunit Mcm2 (Cdc46/Mcm family)
MTTMYDVSEIGITDTEIYAIYKDDRLSMEYDKNNEWEDSINKFRSKIDHLPTLAIEYINKELLLKRIENLAEDEDRKKASWDEIKSVSEAVELSNGDINVKGIITGKSEPSMVIVSYSFSCWNCWTENEGKKYNPPLLLPEKQDRKCMNCKEKATITDFKYEYEPSIKVRLRDEDVLKDTELRVILWGKDCMNVEYGETVIVKGIIHVLQTHGKSPSLVPYTFSNSIRYVSKKEIIVSENDKKANENFIKYPDILDRLVSMFAPNVIEEKDKKLALLRSMVNAQSDIYKPSGAPSSIISTAMVGDMGNAKTMLAKECTKVIPNSKYAGSQNSTGLSLTAMIDTENDVKILRYGVVPLAKHAICVINEFSRMDFKDQAHILDVMSEKSFTISKYGTHREIPAPTTMILTLNQSGTEWRNPDKVDIDEINMLRALTDRVDQLLISRDTRTKEERQAYAEAKREIVRKRPHNYNFLTKYLLHASTIQPTFTRAAEDLINGFWKDMDKMDIGGGNRNLDSIYRIAEAHARLRLSNVVDAEIAQETLDHYKIMLLGYGKVVVVTEDIKKICIDAITKVIKRTPFPITFEEAGNYARMENDKVRNYLGDGRLTPRTNFKFREVYDKFKEMRDRHISIVSNVPLTCIWQCDECDECEAKICPSINKNCENHKNILEDYDRTLTPEIKPNTFIFKITYSLDHSNLC